MNIIQIQNDLKGVDDNQLVEYVKNPQGQVPSYLALTELSRRKNARAAAKPTQPTPTQTVVDQELAPEPTAEPGIASLPLPDDMFNEQNFAQGGIVKFAGRDGSLVRYNPDGSLVIDYQGLQYRNLGQPNPRSPQGEVGSIAPYMTMENVKKFDAEKVAERLNPSTPAVAQPQSQPYNRDFMDSYNEYQSYLDNPNKAVVDPDTEQSMWQKGVNSLFGDTPKSKYEQARQKEYNEMIEASGGRFQIPGITEGAGAGPFTPTTQGYKDAYKNRDRLLEEFAAGKYDPTKNGTPLTTKKGAEETKTKSSNTATAKSPPSVGNTPAEAEIEGGIASLNTAPLTEGFIKYNKPADRSADWDKLLTPEKTVKEGMDEYYSNMGEDTERAGLKSRIAEMRAKTAEDEKDAPWMALANAGFAMAAGDSPFALKNAAVGGIAGIKDFANSKEQIQNAEERTYALESKLASDMRAEKSAALQYGQNSKQAIDKQNMTAKTGKLAYQASRDELNAKQDLEANIASANLGVKVKEIKLLENRIQAAMAETTSSNGRVELQNYITGYSNIMREANDRITEIRKNIGLGQQPTADEVTEINALQKSAIDAMDNIDAILSKTKVNSKGWKSVD